MIRLNRPQLVEGQASFAGKTLTQFRFDFCLYKYELNLHCRMNINISTTLCFIGTCKWRLEILVKFQSTICSHFRTNPEYRIHEREFDIFGIENCVVQNVECKL